MGFYIHPGVKRQLHHTENIRSQKEMLIMLRSLVKDHFETGSCRKYRI